MSTNQHPNFFLSIRVDNSVVVGNIVKAQEKLIERNPETACGVVKPGKFRLTLFFLHISDQETLDAVIETVYTCRVFFINAPPIPLTLSSINNFDRGRVLWIGVQRDNEYARCEAILNKVHQLFTKKHGENVVHSFQEWNPHLTIFKRTRKTTAKLRLKTKLGETSITSAFCREWIGHSFGTQIVSGIELLSMEATVDVPSGYPCFARLIIGPNNNSSLEIQESELPVKGKTMVE